MSTSLRAFCLVRNQPHYRFDSFIAGLRAAGYQAIPGHPQWPVRPGELLVIWNRNGETDQVARRVEAAGGLVLVAENGYIGADAQGIQTYALALHGHAGSGVWPDGGAERWSALGIETRPFRDHGDHIVICGQRGFGAPGMASPPEWHRDVARRLQRITQRPLVIRPHPGKPANHPEVVDAMRKALEGAHACVVWSSANAVRALVEGVPVFYEAPHSILGGAAKRGIQEIDQPLKDEGLRLAALQRMAWAQWTIAEIATGNPIKQLVDLARSSEKAA